MFIDGTWVLRLQIPQITFWSVYFWRHEEHFSKPSAFTVVQVWHTQDPVGTIRRLSQLVQLKVDGLLFMCATWVLIFRPASRSCFSAFVNGIGVIVLHFVHRIRGSVCFGLSPLHDGVLHWLEESWFTCPAWHFQSKVDDGIRRRVLQSIQSIRVGVAFASWISSLIEVLVALTLSRSLAHNESLLRSYKLILCHMSTMLYECCCWVKSTTTSFHWYERKKRNGGWGNGIIYSQFTVYFMWYDFKLYATFEYTSNDCSYSFSIRAFSSCRRWEYFKRNVGSRIMILIHIFTDLNKIKKIE